MAGPRWVRLDIDYFHNPKVLTAGRDGRDLHLASICWVGRYLTDGHIPAQAVRAIMHDAGVTHAAVDAVVAARLWTPNGDGYELHDFVAMNRSRADIETERGLARERARRSRASRGGHA